MPGFDDLGAPATTTRTGLTVGLSPQTRLELAMRRANQDDPSDIPDPVQWSHSSLGVPNPNGRGIAAYEPNNILFDAYRKAKGDFDQHAQAEADAAAAAAGPTGSAAAGAPLMAQGDGLVAKMVNAALALAQRRVPYVWGGTTSNGVDCSGLIMYAARAAGITLDGKAFPRFRAVDYANLGAAVTIDQARAGDIIYYDNPGTDTDHVGIYIGNGQVVQAPQSGDVVKVTGVGRPTSIRRIFEDSAFGTIATPGGGTAVAYGGVRYDPAVGTYQPGLNNGATTASIGSTIFRPAPAPRRGGPQEF